jgi:proteasome lid subunit RPN8/RPN11/molybdopterin converting factor small subunit
MVSVYIPTPFRRATAHRDRVEVAAPDVAGLLDELERAFAGLKGLVRNERGQVHAHVALYVNGEAIDALHGLATRLKDGDEVSIIPALAGGCALSHDAITPDEREAIRGQAKEEYPFESCGVILARGDQRRLLRCRNAQNELHARDPQRYPRDARTAYYIDPKDLLRIGDLEREGFAVAVIYHSHVDTGAYFSETDRRQALVGGEPAYPNAVYVVTSVVGGRVDAMAAFRWNGVDFAPLPIPGEPFSGDKP